jgi:hypothetical protein
MKIVVLDGYTLNSGDHSWNMLAETTKDARFNVIP